MRLTPKQLERKTAYKIDPLMAATVELFDPAADPCRSPVPEIDADQLWRNRVWNSSERRFVWKAPSVLLVLLALFLPLIHTSTDVLAARPDIVVTVQQGDNSLVVAEVQQRLASFGYSVEVDGIFGPQTQGAVLHFQEASGLEADGIVGPITRAAMGLPKSISTGATATVTAGRTAVPRGVYVHPNPNVQRWYTTARAAGWPSSLWQWQSCVINRETGGTGDPSVFNNRGADRSYGLMQINAKAQRAAMIAWAGSEEAFFDAYVNLSYSWHLYQIAGPGPWRSRTHSC